MLWKVLQCLVKSCCHSDDVSCDPKEILYNKTLTLLSRITSKVLYHYYVIINDIIVDQVTSNAEVWQLSAHMHLKAKCPNYEKVNMYESHWLILEQPQVVMELQRALRIMRQSGGWEKNIERCKQVVSLSLEYSQSMSIM